MPVVDLSALVLDDHPDVWGVPDFDQLQKAQPNKYGLITPDAFRTRQHILAGRPYLIVNVWRERCKWCATSEMGNRHRLRGAIHDYYSYGCKARPWTILEPLLMFDFERFKDPDVGWSAMDELIELGHVVPIDLDTANRLWDAIELKTRKDLRPKRGKFYGQRQGQVPRAVRQPHYSWG